MIYYIKKFRAATLLCLLALVVVFVLAVAQQSPTGAPAAAVTNRPKILSVNVATNGHVHLQMSGQAGVSFSIEKSTDLSSWRIVATNSFSAAGEGMFVDTASPGTDASFYRVMQAGTIGETSTTNAAANRRIRKAASNPPTVSITDPTNNATFAAPTNLTINASASDSDGTVTQVQFFSGSTLLGSAMNSPYSVTWSNVAVGTYALTAVATDNDGLSATSSVVNITVTLPQTGSIKLWLQADAISGLTNGAPVATWPDGSGLNNNASQGTTSYQPLYWTNVVNAKPVVRFDGVDDYFALPNFLNGTTQAEAFVVLKATVDTPSTPRSLWRMGTGSP